MCPSFNAWVERKKKGEKGSNLIRGGEKKRHPWSGRNGGEKEKGGGGRGRAFAHLGLSLVERRKEKRMG